MVVRTSSDVAIVYDRERNRFYETRADKLPQYIREQLRPYRERVNVYGAFLLTALLFILAVWNAVTVQGHDAYQMSLGSSLLFFLYISISITIHEGAHILGLRMLGHSVDKIGFKLHYFVLPAFFVRMSQSVLLTKHERVAVHSAGIIANLLVNIPLVIANTVWIQSEPLWTVLRFATVALLLNALPVLNSDGYRVMLAWANIHEKKSLSLNPRWVQGLKAVSIVIVGVYTFNMSMQIWESLGS